MYVSSNPQTGSTNVPLDASITVNFSEDVFLAEPHGITVNGEPVEASISGSVLTIVVNHVTAKSYKVTIPATALTDAAGNLANALSLSFKTETVVTITKNLVITIPSQQTVNLYIFLLENYGKKPSPRPWPRYYRSRMGNTIQAIIWQ